MRSGFFANFAGFTAFFVMAFFPDTPWHWWLINGVAIFAVGTPLCMIGRFGVNRLYARTSLSPPSSLTLLFVALPALLRLLPEEKPEESRNGFPANQRCSGAVTASGPIHV